MSKKFKLFIPKPCHEDWNNMTHSEKGKFCSSCQKQVIDFSTFSDQQLLTYFKLPISSVCGRLDSGQLQKEFIIPEKRLPWMRYFFQFVLPASLLSTRATAQVESLGKVQVICSTGYEKKLPEKSK